MKSRIIRNFNVKNNAGELKDRKAGSDFIFGQQLKFNNRLNKVKRYIDNTKNQAINNTHTAYNITI